jgi:hypothetical protein
MNNADMINADMRNAGMHSADPSARGHGGFVDGRAHARAAQLPVFLRSVERSGMSAESFVEALTQTALSALTAWSQVDLERLLVAAERLGLDPLGREVFLLPGAAGPLDPALLVVGVDGWSRILNGHEQFAGMSFRESRQKIEGVPAWVECTIHRWDRRVPTSVKEHLSEARGMGLAWVSHPRRMLRHKSMVQCARLAFGLVGVYDADEAQAVAASRAHRAPTGQPLGVTAVKRALFGEG